MSHPGFRITGANTVGRLGFLQFDELEVVPPSGRPVTRIVVRHPGAVAVVPIEGDHLMLIRQYRAAVDTELLEIPAGKLDVAGEAPLETARRELEEEMGLRASRFRSLGNFYTTPGFSDELMYLYAAYDLDPVAASPVGPEEEAAQIVAVPLAEVPDLIKAGEVRDAKTLIALWWVVAGQR
jgi:ADP-ribose pyrophosphatase